MNIRTTTDPISLRDVHNPETHPCVYMGDGENGMEVFFENEENRRQFIALAVDDDNHIAIEGNDSDDYVAEG